MMSRLFTLVADVQIRQGDLVNLPTNTVGQDDIARTLRLVFGAAGGLALLIVTIGGLKYVISQGNPQATQQAKDTILYALVGLVISMTAFAIVTFVLGRV